VLEQGHRTADLQRAGEPRQIATTTQQMGRLVQGVLNDILDRQQSLHAV